MGKVLTLFHPGKWVVAVTATTLLCQTPALAQETPRESCTEITNLAAQNKLAELPAMILQASRGNIEVDISMFATLQPVIDSGPVRVNDFLIEKNYNDTLLKSWHLLYFDWQSLYIRCTYLKTEEGWTLINFKFETDEEDIALP